MLTNRKILTLVVLLLSLTFGLWGCGKISPTAPEGEELTAPSRAPDESGLPAEVLWPKMVVDNPAVFVQAQIFSETENIVDLQLPAKYQEFIIRKHAIKQNTTITIAITKYAYWDEKIRQQRQVVEFDFGPDGLEFRKKAKLVLDSSWLGLRTGQQAVLRYYNENTDLWEQISSTAVKQGRVDFYIPHFSKYAVS
jgi:hypothetical protein